ncbi:hypothetical protein M422DRAFT_39756 [Sphaerobolus stellatus SS14]|uniref:Sulfhydryl oxidase n=1 Tax=Sphaerobolus stellatus (strain SS14) TaxID=990650 RepID=A0A0C9UCG9_SPHS4|nr:hypothetical protein M422DRAFT_39756 [Sphaerobolus stellatus SS14]
MPRRAPRVPSLLVASIVLSLLYLSLGLCDIVKPKSPAVSAYDPTAVEVQQYKYSRLFNNMVNCTGCNKHYSIAAA